MNVSEIWSLLKHPRRNWKFIFRFLGHLLPVEASQKELKVNFLRKFNNWVIWSIPEGIESPGRPLGQFLPPRRSIPEGIERLLFVIILHFDYYTKHPRRNWKIYVLLSSISCSSSSKHPRRNWKLRHCIFMSPFSLKHPRRNWKPLGNGRHWEAIY